MLKEVCWPLIFARMPPARDVIFGASAMMRVRVIFIETADRPHPTGARIWRHHGVRF